MASETRVNTETTICLAISSSTNDGSPIVRREVVCTLSLFVSLYLQRFLAVVKDIIQQEAAYRQQLQLFLQLSADKKKKSEPPKPPEPDSSSQSGSVFACIWRVFYLSAFFYLFLLDPCRVFYRSCDYSHGSCRTNCSEDIAIFRFTCILKLCIIQQLKKERET